MPYTAAVDVLGKLVAAAVALGTLVAVAVLGMLVHVDFVDDRDVADDLYGRYYLQGFDSA